MAFLTKSQAAKYFKVSPTTIANWIIATEKKKINLQTATVGSKVVILDSEHNTNLIKNLKLKGKKHIGHSTKTVVQPDPEIYNIFNRQQLTEIVSSITSRSEIPYKFSYFDKGAVLWDKYHRVSTQNKNHFVNSEHQLILDNLSNIINRLKSYKKINIIDIGCGNGLPLIPIIQRLIEQGFDISYIALDISQKMIEIDKQELLKTFPDLVYNSYIIDFDRFNISDILFFNKNDVTTTNLLFCLGGTLGNQADAGRVYTNLRDSMGLDDFLIVSEGVSNSFLKKNVTQPNEYHIKRTIWILDLLGLTNAYSTTIFNVFNPAKRETSRKIEITKDVVVKLTIDSKDIELNFEQGDEILVSRFFWRKETEIIQKVIDCGFAIDQFSTNRDASCALMIVRPKQLR